MEQANSEEAFQSAAACFKNIFDFKDSEAKTEECLKKAEICHRDGIYRAAIRYMDEDTIAAYEAAIRQFRLVGDWKDSSDQINKCKDGIQRIKERQEQQKQMGFDLQKKVNDLHSEIERIRMKLSGLGLFSLKEKKQLQAELEKLEENLKEAEEKKESCLCHLPISIQLEYGDTAIYFGCYKEKTIEWNVIKKEDHRVLVLSKYGLDCQSYNLSDTRITWETCSLRKWLNGTFLNSAFSADEQAQIQSTTVSADKNPEYSTNPGNATTDKVFLLSITEAEQYFSSAESRKCVPTEYAIAPGAWTSDSHTTGGKATCWW